jgi:hypothetical protein
VNIVFEFEGGSRDGQRDEGERAGRSYFLTDNGTVGRRFMGSTDYSVGLLQKLGHESAKQAGAVRSEKYEVVERSEINGEILVRCKFIGYA